MTLWANKDTYKPGVYILLEMDEEVARANHLEKIGVKLYDAREEAGRPIRVLRVEGPPYKAEHYRYD